MIENLLEVIMDGVLSEFTSCGIVWLKMGWHDRSSSFFSGCAVALAMWLCHGRLQHRRDCVVFVLSKKTGG